MLARVVVKNFKSIGGKGIDLKLRPLTILVGPNGGGKSSIIEAIAFASQGGNLGDRLLGFPSFDDIRYKREGRREVTVEAYFDDTVPGGYQYTVSPMENGNIRHGNYVGTSFAPAEMSERIDRSRKNFEKNTFLISAVRGAVPYSQDSYRDADWVGVHGEELLLLLSRIFARREYDDIAGRIAAWAARFGTVGLKAGLWRRGAVASDYLDHELKVTLNLALSSSGARQMLTVITQVFWAPEGSLVLIEEPEISLHPKAQVDLIELFAEVLAEKKQIIATTHSQFLVLALSNAVQQRQLSPQQICIYHVDKGRDGTFAKGLEIDPNGYVKEWIPSFAKVERALLRRWVETLPEE